MVAEVRRRQVGGDGGQLVVAHRNNLGLGSIAGQREGAGQRHGGHLGAGGKQAGAQGGGIELGVVGDKHVAAEEIEELLGGIGKSRRSFHIVRGNAVDGDVDIREVLEAWWRGAQPGPGGGLLAVAEAHRADLADRAPVIVGRFHVHGGEIEAGDGGGGGGGLAALCGGNGAGDGLRVLVRGEGYSAGGAQVEGAEAGGGRFTHAHGVDGLKRDILRGGGTEAGS